MSSASGPVRAFLRRMFAMPSYPPDDRDGRTFRLAGLDLPIRATVAVVAGILIVIFDFQRTFIPAALSASARDPDMQRPQDHSRSPPAFAGPLLIVCAGWRGWQPGGRQRTV